MNRAERNHFFIAITTGDRDGVGLEVARKALSKLGPQKQMRFLLTCSNDAAASRELRKLRGFKPVTLSSRQISLPLMAKVFLDLQPDEILIWRDGGNEAAWVKACAELALSGDIDALVTGPVSKEKFKRLHAKYMGHTGLLSAMARKPVQQGYVGRDLAIVLATDHVPLSKVEKTATPKLIQRAIANAKSLSPLLPASRRHLPIAVLGLNPHAGEDGLLGRFERKMKLPKGVRGPLPPDTAFTAQARRRSSVTVALYHDQGLIPFKMLHGQDSGFQISLGLPFVRTSVDHGTARDIFGLGQANPGSMIDAIRAAVTLVQAGLKPRQKRKRI